MAKGPVECDELLSLSLVQLCEWGKVPCQVSSVVLSLWSWLDCAHCEESICKKQLTKWCTHKPDRLADPCDPLDCRSAKPLVGSPTLDWHRNSSSSTEACNFLKRGSILTLNSTLRTFQINATGMDLDVLGMKILKSFEGVRD